MEDDYTTKHRIKYKNRYNPPKPIINGIDKIVKNTSTDNEQKQTDYITIDINTEPYKIVLPLKSILPKLKLNKCKIPNNIKKR